LYAVACTVCRGDYDLLFQVLRIQRRRELISGLLLTDILRRTLSGEYGAYAQLFCYVPRENLYREAVNAIAALWGRLEEGERFAALSLLRDVCFIYGGYARLETLTDRLTLRQFQLFARKRDKSPRAALNALFCGVSPAWLEAYLADQAGSRVYPAFFNVHAVASVGPGCFGQYPLDQVFADELGLYGQTEPDDDGLYWGLVSLPYEKDWLEAELTADFAGAMTGLVLLPSQEPVFEQLSIANTRLMLLALPSTIRELGRQSLAYYGIHGQWGYRLLMEHGPEKLERDHGIRYGGAMESLTLPASIRVIGEAAFQGDDRLERLTLLSGVAAIGERAFSDCVRLRSISLPDTVTELGERLFAHCSGLTHVTIGSGVKTLPDFAFWGCRRLESVILPESLTQIGAHAFSGCESLKSVQLPPNLRVIGSYAFHGCGGLTEIRIPGLLRFLGNGAFEDCAGLTTAYLPGGLRVIDEDTFCGCVNLESVTLGDGIRKIGQGAFARCEALRQTVLPESLTEIGQYAFKNCLSLEQISLPQGLTDIGIEAFSGCEKLRCAEIPGGISVIQSAAFAGCIALEELKLNPGLAEIWEMAFTSCSSLRSVHIPETVTEIGNAVFYGCGALQTIQVPAKTGVGTDAFAGCPGAAETYDPLEDDITLLFGSHEACEAYRESQETNEEIVIDGSMCPGGVLDRENATRLLPRMRFFRLRIGDGIHTIDNGALEQAAGFRERLCVTEVILSDSVKRIGAGAFQNCEHLTRAVLPRDLDEIPDGLFCGCRGLQTVILPALEAKVTSTASGSNSSPE